MASQAGENEKDSCSKSDASSSLRVSPVSMMPVRPKMTYYISLSDWANPTLQISSTLPSITSDNSKEYITSEVDSWYGNASLPSDRARAMPDDSYVFLNANNCFCESPLSCRMMNQERELQAYCPSVIELAFHKLELPSEIAFSCHADSIYDNRMIQPGHKTEDTQSETSMPTNPLTVVHSSTVLSEYPKGVVLPDCCSPSRKSVRQASVPDNKVLESGWTRYLDQLTVFKACPSSPEDPRLRSNFNRYTQKAYFDDPSMASDASSGPEPPLSYEDLKEIDLAVKKNAHGTEVFSGLENDRFTPKINGRDTTDRLMAITGGRMSKRRKTDLDNSSSPATCCMPSCRKDVLKVPEEEMGAYSFEVSSDSLDTEQESKTYKSEEGAIVNDRLEALQQLIPNSDTLDKEEMLASAIIYVKSLESKIKMFEAAQLQIVDRAEIEATKNFLSSRES